MDFNRNYHFVIKITILPFFHKLEFLGSYNKDIIMYEMERKDQAVLRWPKSLPIC